MVNSAAAAPVEVSMIPSAIGALGSAAIVATEFGDHPHQ
jgi:hypothetical protein